MLLPKYDCGMTQQKRKVSLTLDADLVAELEKSDEPLSAQVNAVILAEVERRRHQRGLRALLDYFDETDGPLDTEEDEREIQRFMRLLGGPA